MSLAIYAAPFDNELNQVNSNDNNDTPIGRKRAINAAATKTQKRYPSNVSQPPKENTNMYSEKVNSILQTIHNLPAEHGDGLGDFNPLPPPTSAGVENTRLREGNEYKPYATNSPPDLDIGMAAATTTSNISPYGTQYSVGTPQFSAANYNTGYYGGNTNESNYDIMIEKLNYMINLLEEQKDERTNNVTEEVVLYSFLGIFIIFIVDSFARVGKYTR